jgi:MFS family permease
MKKIYTHYLSSYAGLPRAAWMLALVVLINRSGSMVLFFLSLYLTNELHYSVSDTGKLISLYGIGSLIGTYTGGWLSDLYGTKKIQLWSLLLSGLGFIILGNISSMPGIALMLFILAITAEAFRPANSTAMAQVCSPEIRTRGFALIRLAVNMGFTIGPVAGGFLAHVNYSYIFWVDGLTCLAAAILFWIIFYKGKVKTEPALKTTTEWKRSPWADKTFLNILSQSFIIGVVLFQIFNTWPLYLKQEYQLLEYQIGSIMAVNTLLIVLFEMPVIHKLEKSNPLKIMRMGTIFFFSGFALLQFGNSYGYAIFTIIIWTIGEMLLFPLCASFIANLAFKSNIGRYMGLYTFTFSLSFAVGPFFGSLTYEHISPSALWSIIGILGIFVWIRFKLLEKRLKKEHI